MLDLIQATATLDPIPAEEWNTFLDITQQRLIERFLAEQPRSIELFKVDAFPIWVVTSGTAVVADMSLRTAIRLVKEQSRS